MPEGESKDGRGQQQEQEDLLKVMARVGAGLGDEADPLKKDGVGFIGEWVHGGPVDA
jgi:hypothetical protein